MADIWQEKRQFEETNFHMLNDNTLCDVTFLVGSDKTEVKAHRFILASRSPVFYAMFCGELSETSDHIEIKDIETDTMHTLLRFLYTEDCVVTGESIMSLWYASKKYHVKRLDQKCQTFLAKEISEENVCDIFIQAHMFDELELKQNCLKYILANGKQVLQTDGFTTLPKQLLREILESDKLASPETDIYNSCKRWATHQLLKSDESRNVCHSDIRNILGDMLYFVRFPTMSMENFITKCSEDDILTANEKVSIFQFIGSQTRNKIIKFRSEKRMRKKQIITRFPKNGALSWMYSGKNTEALAFSVSHTAMLFGVGMYTPTRAGSVKGTVSVLDKNMSVILKKHVVIEHSQSSNTTEILFGEEIALEPGIIYILSTFRNATLGQGSIFIYHE